VLDANASPCQACGACCAYAKEWPRFSTEDESALARIPEAFVDPSLSGMRCDGDRCSALIGEIGTWTSCAIYEGRPDVCRACVAGDDACTMARMHYGMAVIEEA
jgi:uncharacterized protein